MNNIDTVSSIYANGTPNISAASSADNFVATKDGLKLAASATQTYVANYAKGCSTPKLAAIIGAGAALAHDRTARPYFDRAAFIKPTAPPADPGQVALIAPKSAEEFHTFQNAAIMLAVATKVNYYKMAHHTGQGVFTGYAAKAAKVLDVQVTTDADISAVWRLGHWFDTRKVLTNCGIKGIKRTAAAAPGAAADDDDEDDDEEIPYPLFEVSPEVTKRISTNPAGTAPLFDCLAAIEAVQVVPVINMIESVSLTDYDKWKAAAEEVMKNPVQYHVGAKYLCGRAPKSVPIPPEYVFVWLKSVLDVTGACASLLESSAFSRVSVNIGVTKAIKAAEEGATATRPETINTLAHYTAGAASIKVAASKDEVKK